MNHRTSEAKGSYVKEGGWGKTFLMPQVVWSLAAAGIWYPENQAEAGSGVGLETIIHPGWGCGALWYLFPLKKQLKPIGRVYALGAPENQGRTHKGRHFTSSPSHFW